MELTVACVLRSGGIYTPEWVSKLRNGVASNLARAHRFVALSDVPVDCERIPLAHDWPTWWAKMEIFTIPGPVLFIDLDTLITGPINDIAALACRERFIMLRDFYRPQYRGGGLMAWSGDMSGVYREFAADAGRLMTIGRPRMGEQAYLEEVVPDIACWQDFLPGQVVSYKADKCADSLPPHARVMCLHGVPKFGDMAADSWARRAWEGL